MKQLYQELTLEEQIACTGGSAIGVMPILKELGKILIEGAIYDAAKQAIQEAKNYCTEHKEEINQWYSDYYQGYSGT